MWSDSSMTDHKEAGGFMDESYDQSDTSAQSEEGAELTRGTNVIPLMICELKEWTKETQTITGVPVRLISCVAVVRKITPLTTKVTYEIEDETGSMLAHKWLDPDRPGPVSIELNTYARIYGSLRSDSQGAHIFILKIEPVNTLSEVLAHIYEVVFMSMKLNQVGAVEVVEDKTMEVDDDPCHGLTTEQKTIFKIIKANDTDNGIERPEIKAKVPSNLLSKVDDIIEFLVGEGHIYTARTDDHFKAT